MSEGVGCDLDRQERAVSRNHIIRKKGLPAAAADGAVNWTLFDRVRAAIWPHPMKETVTVFTDSLSEAPTQQTFRLRVHVGDCSREIDDVNRVGKSR